jgi:hypothetical protein
LRAACERGALSGFGSFYPEFVFDDDSLWQAGLSDPRLTAVSAHNIRRFPAEIHGRPMHYFTLLRHPVPHFLSIVRYIMQQPEKFDVPASVNNTSLDVARWLLDRRPGSTFRENTQTDHLALYPWSDTTRGRCAPDRYESWDAADRERYERERLNIAKDVLRSFIAVGTVERLPETLEILRRRSARHGLQLLPVANVPHVNVTHLTVDDISWLENDPVGERVYASVAVDWELYQFAQALTALAIHDEWKLEQEAVS